MAKHKEAEKLEHKYFDRDLSWLSFNYRVLLEARDPEVRLFDKIKFLAIFSSNLDEFFRVRVASLRSLINIGKKKINKRLDLKPKRLLKSILETVNRHQEEYGQIFADLIIPELEKNQICLYMGQEINGVHRNYIDRYFKSRILSFLNPKIIEPDNHSYFLYNRHLYFGFKLRKKSPAPTEDAVQYAYLNIPSNELPRYYNLPVLEGVHHIISLDDMIRENLEFIFPDYHILECGSIKLNRDAELNIEDEFTGDLIEKISKTVAKRNIGVPSRFLYDQSLSSGTVQFLAQTFELNEDDLIPGGRYHNLHDLMKLKNPSSTPLESEKPKGLIKTQLDRCRNLFEAIDQGDQLLHFPYYNYDYVLRFFNEAALDPFVEEIKVTFYRIAANSLIGNALISAAKNGKKVTVFVEVKARFDEENNLRWAKRMKQAGIQIIYSIPGLKVHAKVALVHRSKPNQSAQKYAFLGTGNFNEETAGIYSDHGLMTCHQGILAELEQVYQYLLDRTRPENFKHILVSQFNLQDRFLELMDEEIARAEQGKPAKMVLKFNNLQDKVMIDKLYQASVAGVEIHLILRGICCLVPGIKNQSERITVRRLVDQYLEHGRAFWFMGGGQEKLFLGSADWMNRNLYRRIEVMFPVYDRELIAEITTLLNLQLQDNAKAVTLDKEMNNLKVPSDPNNPVLAQKDIYYWLKKKEEEASSANDGQ